MTILAQLARRSPAIVAPATRTASLHSSVFRTANNKQPTKADLASDPTRTNSEAAVKADSVTQSPEELQKEATRIANDVDKNKSALTGNAKVDQEVKDQIEGRKAARGVEG